ncbi:MULTISPECIES: hypothetical protein [unclassified Duganella]|uniref:hypothetical protein n=1 Tax=unclassified Duganella TaxID=2636909 RepID=UPI0006FFCAD9|nr:MULTISPECIES: hypothetical protein [unclassified Duganella]KQV53936.1 hypothetical protein ASD07_05160 [Duganella sp. Root336D2]KRB98148.1 hypothetical protein ASE26_24840 [Duganella sp. Root198D2]
MGYHISILRTASDPIRLEEVSLAVGRMSGRLAFDGDAQPDPQVYQPARDGESEIMLLEDGELWAKSPSEEFLRLMIDLAGLLGARVRGDELETYRAPDQTYHHPDDSGLIAEAAELSRKMASRQRSRDWLTRFATVGVAAMAGWIYARFIK